MSDNGPQFISSEFTFISVYERSAPYHLASNGGVEGLVHTFKQAMKAGDNDSLSNQHHLENFLLTYHSICNNPSCRMDLLHPDISLNVESNQALQKQQHDRHTCERVFTQ